MGRVLHPRGVVAGRNLIAYIKTVPNAILGVHIAYPRNRGTEHGLRLRYFKGATEAQAPLPLRGPAISAVVPVAFVTKTD